MGETTKEKTENSFIVSSVRIITYILIMLKSPVQANIWNTRQKCAQTTHYL